MFICEMRSALQSLKIQTDLSAFARVQGDVQTAEGCKAIVESVAAKESYVSYFPWKSCFAY